MSIFVLPGNYCPQNTSLPIPCEAGKYNPNEYMGQYEDCLVCPKDHFQHLIGMAGCFSCGGDAEQPLEGQVTCTCYGAGRDFQVRRMREEDNTKKHTFTFTISYLC